MTVIVLFDTPGAIKLQIFAQHAISLLGFSPAFSFSLSFSFLIKKHLDGIL
jgi:hypothetical protein